MTVDACALSTEEITITPTIPIRRSKRGLPKIRFRTPPDVDLLDTKSSCEIELPEGTNSKTVKIKAACKQGGVTQGLQVIVPKISFGTHWFWHPRKVGLPTVWVCVFSFIG